MARRIVTARQQYDLLSPWRTATQTFPYLRNNGGMRHVPGFDQHLEPWGRYMSHDVDEHHMPLQHGWERGTVSFDNPLYVPHEYGAWKQTLSDQYGATGRQLSEKLMADGYDGVITHDKYGIGEIVDVRPKDQRGHRVAAPQQQRPHRQDELPFDDRDEDSGSLWKRPRGLGEDFDPFGDLDGVTRYAASPKYGPDKLMGVNINDTLQDFTGQILSGEKTVETRNTKSLHPYVGRRVGILSTHDTRSNPRVTYLVGFATVGEPKFYDNAADFDADYDLHRVAPGSDFHIDHPNCRHGVKWGYPMHDVKHVDPVVVDSTGIVTRDLTQHMHLAAEWHREGAADDYRGYHQAPDAEYGAPLHDVEMMFPDYHQHPEYYRTYQPYDHQSESKILKYRGRPDAKVDIYRALPMSAATRQSYGMGFPLNRGDWVTTSYDYAKEHGESNLDKEPWTILHTKAPASALFTEGNSIHEWAYHGDDKLAVEHPTARSQRYRRKKRSQP